MYWKDNAHVLSIFWAVDWHRSDLTEFLSWVKQKCVLVPDLVGDFIREGMRHCVVLEGSIEERLDSIVALESSCCKKIPMASRIVLCTRSLSSFCSGQ